MKSGSHSQKNRLIDEIMNRLTNVEEELDYENCIKDGSWDTAIEIMERRIAKIKEKRFLAPKPDSGG